ncbi:ABC transporter permease [Clostridium luticellarii]|uniref:Inner membrane transport permease YbhR n=1 Tax=Clostridium luticellarii TaxID=1691940 RepID=A0A2T0BP56_9CLOT|nr:ABC transporter permease [Clostridium luticellarii]MCI1944652.1 ABC transporter permease [Clostridium luticellarii]MCI1968151.1 ABC transporter permease [Clostridium luticellarii]MCI1994736.1 ABC transporter permease [Clostridium luticellarii]MCI2038968.1 ABC transporter permease [Clostridium luticellarii]PRR85656.1 Inner membrane transport permease YbhR [Clostridium luticellarii]
MRIAALTIRILCQLRNDKRTMALMILAPIFVLTLMSYIFNGTQYDPKIGVINAPESFIEELEGRYAVIARYSESQADMLIRESKLDAVINYKRGIPYITLEGSDPGKSKAVIALVQNSIQGVNQEAKPDITYLYGYEDMSSFDNFGPMLIGFFVFFFVFLISGVSFLRERTQGTLERLLATPIRRREIVLGYILGFGIFTIIQAALIAWFSINVINMMMVGSFILVLIITFLTSMVALTMGTALSAFAENELQMIQFIPLVVIPQVFFSGIFDMSTMPAWLQLFGRFMPLYYSADALKQIMIRGRGIASIWIDIFVLLGICIVFIVLNILALKKYRKI